VNSCKDFLLFISGQEAVLKFKIKSWIDGGVLFSAETETLKMAVELAINSGASLDRASLDRASLDGASLDGASLDRASLVGASLVGASLDGASLDGASLDRASLVGASLVGASLVGASLVGASLVGATGLEKFPIQIGGHKHWLCTTNDGKLKIGCEVHTFDEWIQIADELGGKNHYSPLDIEIYKLNIEHVARIAKLLWNAKKKPAT
jgi:hypothetical protein